VAPPRRGDIGTGVAHPDKNSRRGQRHHPGHQRPMRHRGPEHDRWRWGFRDRSYSNGPYWNLPYAPGGGTAVMDVVPLDSTGAPIQCAGFGTCGPGMQCQPLYDGTRDNRLVNTVCTVPNARPNMPFDNRWRY